MICYRIRVVGRVQGVFFRVSTKDQAIALGLSGWVRNEVDGSVLIEVCGPNDQVQTFIQWCSEGPPSSSVDEVTVEEIEVQDFESFRITY